MGIFFGVGFPGGSCPGGIILVGILRVGVFLVPLYQSSRYLRELLKSKTALKKKKSKRLIKKDITLVEFT